MTPNKKIITTQTEHIAVLLEVIDDLRTEVKSTEQENAALRKARDNWKKAYLDLLESTVQSNEN